MQPLLLNDGEGLSSKLKSRGIAIFYDPNRFPVQEESTDRSLILAQLQYVEGYFSNEKELLQLTNKTSVDEALEIVMGTGVTFVALQLGTKGCHITTSNADYTV